MVGNEGIVGIALFMGGDTMPNRAVVQSAGHTYRLQGEKLRIPLVRANKKTVIPDKKVTDTGLTPREVNFAEGI